MYSRLRLTIVKLRYVPNFNGHPVVSKNAHFGIFLVVFFPTTSSTFAKTQYYIYCTFHSTTTKINCATPSILKITKIFQFQTLLLIFEMHWDKSSVFLSTKNAHFAGGNWCSFRVTFMKFQEGIGAVRLQMCVLQKICLHLESCF